MLIGGGQVGIETAVWLKRQGHEVTLVEARDGLMKAPVEPIALPNQHMLLELLTYHQIPVHLSATVKSFIGDQVTINHADGTVAVKADQIVLSIGYTSDDNLYRQVYNKIPKKVWLLGDARQPGTIMTAIRDGSAAGAAI